MEHKRQTQEESPVSSSVISAAREVVSIAFVQSISRTLSRSKENRGYTIAASNEDLAPSSTAG